MKNMKFFYVFLLSLGVKDTDAARFVGVSHNLIGKWFQNDDTYIGYVDMTCRALGYSLTILFYSPQRGVIEFSADCPMRGLADRLGISRADMARSIGISPLSVGYVLRQNLDRMMVSRLHEIADGNGYMVYFRIIPLPREEGTKMRHDGNRFVATVYLLPLIFDGNSTIPTDRGSDRRRR